MTLNADLWELGANSVKTRSTGELVAFGIEDEVGHVLVGGLACPDQQREDTDLYCEEDNVAGVAAAL